MTFQRFWTGALALCALALAAAPASAQRQVLPEGVAPVRYDLSVNVDPDRMDFTGEMRITVDVAASAPTVSLNAADMTITRASIDGSRAAFALDNDAETLTLTPRRALAPGRHTLIIAYQGRVFEDAYGLFRSTYQDNGEKHLLVTQFEAGDARRFAPMWDQPDRKAVFAVTATFPTGLMGVSNAPIAETRALSGGRQRVRFADTPVMSSYLLFFSVGDYERITTQVGDTEIGVITRRGETEKGRFALQAAAQILPWYNEYFGTPYPLPKLDMIAVPGAGGFGAMENWGAILYFDQALLVDPAFTSESFRQYVYTTVAHEMAHQWFGDLVTMSWWDDLWLNEGFAEWMASKVTEHFRPDWDIWLSAADRRDDAMFLDALPGTHPIVQRVNTIGEANLAFDDITYDKGSAVIRMIESYMGENAFRDGIRAYMRAHAHGNTTTADLWRSLEAASNQPISQLAHSFTDQPGVPLVRADSAPCRRGAQGSSVTLSQERFGLDESQRTQALWETPLRLRTIGAAQDATTLFSAATGAASAPGACGVVIVNSGQGAYVRVLYADDDFAAIRSNFARLSHADQMGLLMDAWAEARGGYVNLSNYLSLIEALPAQADPLVLIDVSHNLSALWRRNRGRASQAQLEAFAQRALRPAFDRVGWSLREGENPNDVLLRAELIGALARMGDAQIAAEARRRALSDDPAAMPGPLREAILRAAASRADAATFTALVAKFRAAQTFVEKDQYLRALPEVQDPALASQLLALSLDDATPRQLRALIVARTAAAQPSLAWDFLRAHREQLEAQLDPLRRLSFGPNIASALDQESQLAQFRDYAASLPHDSAMEIARAEAAIRLNTQYPRVLLPQMDAYFARRPHR